MEAALSSTEQLSTTTPIPIVSVIEDLDLKSTSHLEIFCPNKPPVRIEIGRHEIVIGRDDDCRIYLPLANVSRRHARIFPRGEEVILEDIGSTNGTYVNGVKITRCFLRNNDQIRVGETRIQFLRQKTRAKS